MFQSLFYWITYSYYLQFSHNLPLFLGFNPYFTGLPILIDTGYHIHIYGIEFQSLFYWITYSYEIEEAADATFEEVSILILLDYLFLLTIKNFLNGNTEGFNPYFTGLPILIPYLSL